MPNQLRELVERVIALEQTSALLAERVGIGHNNPPDPIDSEPTDLPKPETDQRLTKKKLAARWGVSDRWVDRRREDDPDFPTPDIQNHRIYFWLSHVLRYERRRVRSTPKTNKGEHLNR